MASLRLSYDEGAYGGMWVQSVTSFHSTGIPPDRLNAVMTAYVAVERVRTFRRLLVIRFGLLAAVVAGAGLGLRWLTPFASWFTVGLFISVPMCAWLVEIICDRRLARRLATLPDAAVQVVDPPQA